MDVHKRAMILQQRGRFSDSARSTSSGRNAGECFAGGSATASGDPDSSSSHRSVSGEHTPRSDADAQERVSADANMLAEPVPAGGVPGLEEPRTRVVTGSVLQLAVGDRNTSPSRNSTFVRDGLATMTTQITIRETDDFEGEVEEEVVLVQGEGNEVSVGESDLDKRGNGGDASKYHKVLSKSNSHKSAGSADGGGGGPSGPANTGTFERRPSLRASTFYYEHPSAKSFSSPGRKTSVRRLSNGGSNRPVLTMSSRNLLAKKVEQSQGHPGKSRSYFFFTSRRSNAKVCDSRFIANKSLQPSNGSRNALDDRNAIDQSRIPRYTLWERARSILWGKPRRIASPRRHLALWGRKNRGYNLKPSPLMRTGSERVVEYQKKRWNLRVHPESPALQSWDMMLMCLIAISGLITPYEVAFMEPSLGILFFINRVIDLIFLADVCLHFLTPYQDKSKLRSSPYVTSYREIAMRYIRGWFVVDMLACIPWDAVYMLISDLQGSGAQIRLLRLMKALRLFALARVLKTSRIYKRWEIVVGVKHKTMQLISFAILVGFISHWIACVWGMVAWAEDAEINWQKVYFGYLEGTTEADGGALLHDVADVKGLSLYITCLYWSVTTLTTIGYGDVVPYTDTERLITLLTMLLGGSIYAYMVGAICGNISDQDSADAQFYNTIDKLNNFMEDRDLDKDLRLRLRQYFYEFRPLLEEPRRLEILEKLTPALRAEVVGASNYAWLRELRIFQCVGPHLEKPFFTGLALVLTPRAWSAGEFIIRVGDTSDRCYLIQRGIATRLQADRLPMEVPYGEILGDEALVGVPHRKRKYAVRVDSLVVAYSFSRDNFYLVLDRPEFRSIRRRIRRALLRKVFQRCVRTSILRIVRNGGLSPSAAGEDDVAVADAEEELADEDNLQSPVVENDFAEVRSQDNTTSDKEEQEKHREEDTQSCCRDEIVQRKSSSPRGISPEEGSDAAPAPPSASTPCTEKAGLSAPLSPKDVALPAPLSPPRARPSLQAQLWESLPSRACSPTKSPPSPLRLQCMKLPLQPLHDAKEFGVPWSPDHHREGFTVTPSVTLASASSSAAGPSTAPVPTLPSSSSEPSTCALPSSPMVHPPGGAPSSSTSKAAALPMRYSSSSSTSSASSPCNQAKQQPSSPAPAGGPVSPSRRVVHLQPGPSSPGIRFVSSPSGVVARNADDLQHALDTAFVLSSPVGPGGPRFSPARSRRAGEWAEEGSAAFPIKREPGEKRDRDGRATNILTSTAPTTPAATAASPATAAAITAVAADRTERVLDKGQVHAFASRGFSSPLRAAPFASAAPLSPLSPALRDRERESWTQLLQGLRQSMALQQVAMEERLRGIEQSVAAIAAAVQTSAPAGEKTHRNDSSHREESFPSNSGGVDPTVDEKKATSLQLPNEGASEKRQQGAEANPGVVGERESAAASPQPQRPRRDSFALDLEAS